MRTPLLIVLGMFAVMPAQASQVLIQRPYISITSGEQVRHACGHVDTACTKFERTVLECVCERGPRGWAPKVRITVRPRMFLSHIQFEPHELAHIADYDYALSTHARSVESRSFESASACEAFTDAVHESFGDVLQKYVRDSMLLRDGKVIETTLPASHRGSADRQ